MAYRLRDIDVEIKKGTYIEPTANIVQKTTRTNLVAVVEPEPRQRPIDEVINITEQGGEILISGRELHEFLGIGTRYNDWFNRMLEYGFVEG